MLQAKGRPPNSRNPRVVLRTPHFLERFLNRSMTCERDKHQQRIAARWPGSTHLVIRRKLPPPDARNLLLLLLLTERRLARFCQGVGVGFERSSCSVNCGRSKSVRRRPKAKAKIRTAVGSKVVLVLALLLLLKQHALGLFRILNVL